MAESAAPAEETKKAAPGPAKKGIKGGTATAGPTRKTAVGSKSTTAAAAASKEPENSPVKNSAAAA